jgi:hypothetical protein
MISVPTTTDPENYPKAEQRKAAIVHAKRLSPEG